MQPTTAWASNRPLWALLDELQGSQGAIPEPASSIALEAANAQPLCGEVAQQVLDVFWASPYPVTLQDAQFRFIDINPAYLAFTGYEREQLIGRQAQDLQHQQSHSHPDPDPDPDPNQHQDAARHARPRLLNGRLITAGGQERRFRFARRLLQDEVGQVTYLAVIQDRSLDITEQHHGEFRNQVRLDELATIVDHTPAGIAYIRGDVLVHCNRRFDIMMRRTIPGAAQGAHGTSAGKSIHRLFEDNEQAKRFAQDISVALKKSSLFETEIEIPVQNRRGHSTLWYSLSVRRTGSRGDAMEAIAVLSDITRLKAQQQALQQLARDRAEQSVALHTNRTRAILDSVLVGIVTVGPCGIEWMNRSARRMFGGDLADFIDTPISTVATAESDHPFLQTHYLNELVEGQAETFECRVKARDGREFWVVGKVVATGREHCGRQLTYALLDIERRRQAEARIEQAQASLQRIIEAAPMAITLRDAKTLKVLQINETAARILGRPAHDLIGKSLEEMHNVATATAMRADMAAALRTSEVTKREYTITTDGQARIWDARFMPLSTRNLTPTLLETQPASPDQLLLVATDVTEQRLAQQAKFDAAIAQREMLVKEVHHRIKNNLQGVAGLLQQIAQRKPEVAPAMVEIITQVQAIAHVYGLQVGTDGPLRLSSVLQAITASVQRTFGHPITLTVDKEAGAPDPQSWVLPEAESIPIALGLNELLTNAIKHTTSAQGESPCDVTCKLVCLNSGVRIDICNRGQLKDGFDLSKIPGGVSGLGLVRALLPRRSATLSLTQEGADVMARVMLTTPGVQNSEQTTTAPAAVGF